MTRLFDGLTGIAAEVFGAPVLYVPAAGAPRTVQSIFRRIPVRAVGPDGSDVLLTSPTWRVRQDLVPELARDDTITAGGASWRVRNVWPQGSIATDAHLICELDGPLP